MPYLLCFYVPKSHLESVKTAIFEAGGGQLGEYQYCAWQIEGEGQYLPLSKATPFKGKNNQLSHEHEYKVEIHCGNDDIQTIVDAMKKVHPYEVPAYHVLALADF